MPSRLLLAAAALSLVLTSACGAAGRAAEIETGSPGTTDDGRPTIALVGDSITEQSHEEVTDYGDRQGFRTRIDATAGFMTREKQGSAEIVATERPDAAVIALGTNDAVCRLTNALVSGSCRYPAFTIADMNHDLRRMAETLHASGACVVGVNAYFGEEIGTELQVLVDEGLLDGIVDWRATVNADESLRADGIGHLTATGERVYASTVIDETARICGL